MRVPNRKSAPGIEHFGERLRRSKFGFRMTREMYAYPSRTPKQRPYRWQYSEEGWRAEDWKYRDEEHTRFSDAYLLVQRDKALRNFDLTMDYFASLDGEEFEAELQHVLDKGRTFKPVQSLQDWDGVSGAYIMVFDEYRQFYVGQAYDIRKRIKQRWGARKPFDRLIHGTHYESVLPVDELRALDTTRIFAARSTNPFAVEERAEKAGDPRYCLNRMGGGAVDDLAVMEGLASPRSRSYVAEPVPMSWEDSKLAWQGVLDLIEQARTSTGTGLTDALAGLDMRVHSIARENGTPLLWSRRDIVGEAVSIGKLSVEEYAASLEALGEKVVWLED